MSERAEIARMGPTEPVAAVTPMEMIDRALARGADPDTLSKLLALQERWEANQGRKAFDQAIAAAKAEIQPILKNRTVDFTSAKGRTHYQHEDLAQIARQVDPILSRHGLSYRYRTEQDGQSVIVTCILSHREGYSEQTKLASTSDQSGNKNHIQAVGSTITYLQRYTLKAALGLAASADDDGRAAGSGGTITAQQFQTLAGKIEEAGADEGKFIAFLGVDHLEELPAAKFNDALAALNAKIRQKGKADA